MFKIIQDKCNQLIKSFDDIDPIRQNKLKEISEYIQKKLERKEEVNLIYICTHNSRRSQFGQIWASIAALYYGVINVHFFSGGTEETSFNINAINALIKSGFKIDNKTDEKKPKYRVKYGESHNLICFSKVFDNPINPFQNFAAIMTCSDAEENCPFIPGAEFRISITYEDPKVYDETPMQEKKYLECSNQIGLESLFIFSQIKK